MTVIRLPRIAVNERCLLYIPRHGVDKNVSTVVGSGASNSKHYWSPSPPVRDMLVLRPLTFAQFPPRQVDLHAW